MFDLETSQLCSPAEALQFAEQVNQLQASWIKRDDLALYTLGAAAYLDSPTDATLEKFGLTREQPSDYQDQSQRINSLLQNQFGHLYKKIVETLKQILNAEVIFADGKALPGFHIFNHSESYANPSVHVAHFDRQYENLVWPTDIAVGDETTVSFTLPLKLPADGGGLLLWGVNLSDVLKLDQNEAKKLIKAARPKKEEYALGHLVCHPGHKLHRIATWKSQPGDQRITLQGHALKIDHSWHVYW